MPSASFGLRYELIPNRFNFTGIYRYLVIAKNPNDVIYYFESTEDINLARSWVDQVIEISGWGYAIDIMNQSLIAPFDGISCVYPNMDTPEYHHPTNLPAPVPKLLQFLVLINPQSLEDPKILNWYETYEDPQIAKERVDIYAKTPEREVVVLDLISLRVVYSNSYWKINSDPPIISTWLEVPVVPRIYYYATNFIEAVSAPQMLREPPEM